MEDINDKIQAFLKGRLGEEEQQLFAQRIEQEPALAKKVRFWRAILDATTPQAMAEQEFEALSHAIIEEELSEAELDQLSQSSKPWIWGLGAGTLIALGIWFWWPVPTSPDSGPTQHIAPKEPVQAPAPVRQDTSTKAVAIETSPTSKPIQRDIEQQTLPPPMTPQRLALVENQYRSFVDVSSVRSGQESDLNSQGKNADEQAVIAFADSNYHKVVKLLPGQSKELLLESLKIRAESHFRLRNFEQAAQDFKVLVDQDPNNFVLSNWNLFLCLWAQGNKANRAYQEQLEVVTAEDFPLAEEAKALHRQAKQ